MTPNPCAALVSAPQSDAQHGQMGLLLFDKEVVGHTGGHRDEAAPYPIQCLKLMGLLEVSYTLCCSLRHTSVKYSL